MKRTSPMPKPKKQKGVAEPIALYDAKTQLSDLVDQAAAGREFIISKSGKPMAKLVPFGPANAKALRVPGKFKGKIWMADDFDAPLPPEILKLWTGEE